MGEPLGNISHGMQALSRVPTALQLQYFSDQLADIAYDITSPLHLRQGEYISNVGASVLAVPTETGLFEEVRFDAIYLDEAMAVAS